MKTFCLSLFNNNCCYSKLKLLVHTVSRPQLTFSYCFSTSTCLAFLFLNLKRLVGTVSRPQLTCSYCFSTSSCLVLLFLNLKVLIIINVSQPQGTLTSKYLFFMFLNIKVLFRNVSDPNQVDFHSHL